MTHVTRLPTIYGGGPTAQVDPRMSPFAREFAVLWLAALPDDRRELMVLDDRLAAAAMQHAQYLDSRTEQEIAERANVSHASHYGRDWSMSNDRVMDAGYRLPVEYKRGSNNVESNARDGGGPLAALKGLLASEFHGPFMRGEGGYARQTVFGVGNCQADFVVLTAPPEQEVL